MRERRWHQATKGWMLKPSCTTNTSRPRLKFIWTTFRRACAKRWMPGPKPFLRTARRRRRASRQWNQPKCPIGCQEESSASTEELVGLIHPIVVGASQDVISACLAHITHEGERNKRRG